MPLASEAEPSGHTVGKYATVSRSDAGLASAYSERCRTVPDGLLGQISDNQADRNPASAGGARPRAVALDRRGFVVAFAARKIPHAEGARIVVAVAADSGRAGARLRGVSSSGPQRSGHGLQDFRNGTPKVLPCGIFGRFTDCYVQPFA